MAQNIVINARLKEKVSNHFFKKNFRVNVNAI